MALEGVSGQAAYYFGLIKGAAADKLGTRDLWNRISDWEFRTSTPRPPGLFAAVSKMRSLATSQRIARDLLAKVADATVIDSRMITQDISSRPLNEQADFPIYKINFEAVVQTVEGQTTQWMSYFSRGGLPTTKGDLMSILDTEAPAIAATSPILYLGMTGKVEILAV